MPRSLNFRVRIGARRLRGFSCRKPQSTCKRRKRRVTEKCKTLLESETHMNVETVIIIIASASAVWAWAFGRKTFFRAFIVAEGYAGLLYRKGQFAELLGPGRHVRWGRFLTLNVTDIR